VNSLEAHLEARNAELLAEAADAEFKAAALTEWARRVVETVERNRKAYLHGWVIGGPPSLKQVEAGMRRRGKKPGTGAACAP